mgnify:CR=1 FL=1
MIIKIGYKKNRGKKIMPFVKRLVKQITPKRVYSLCKLVDNYDLKRDEAIDLLQPDNINNSQNAARTIFNFSSAERFL